MSTPSSVSGSRYSNRRNKMANILVVDDEATITTQLEERLAVLGYDVVGTASSGKEAVELAEQLRPDMVLMDIVMPGELDGIEAARLIKEKMDIPVVFLTAYGDDRFIDRAMDTAPYGYIIKPYQESALKAAIEVALYNSELMRCLKESELGWKRLALNMEDAVVLCDANGKIFFWNRGAENLFGFTAEEIIGSPFKKLISEGAQQEYIQEMDRLFIQGKSPISGCWLDLPGVRKDYSRFSMELCLTPLEYRHESAFVGIVRDVTAHKKAETRYKTSLEEKERLLDDVRRSVKENLNLIYGLIDMQQACFDSREGLKGRRIGRSRLEALTYAQERAVGTEISHRIDFSEYVQNLISRLVQSYAVDEKRINIELNIEPVPLDIGRAAACGLIISELVSNAFKYAFPDTSLAGCVDIAFHQRDNQYVLKVQDDGIGFPVDQKFPSKNTQGLRIVTDLVSHLQGKLDLEMDGGAGIQILFPAAD
jgi:PAS domain S-box-containing protein